MTPLATERADLDLSVVVASYNTRDLLRACLATLRARDPEPLRRSDRRRQLVPGRDARDGRERLSRGDADREPDERRLRAREQPGAQEHARALRAAAEPGHARAARHDRPADRLPARPSEGRARGVPRRPARRAPRRGVQAQLSDPLVGPHALRRARPGHRQKKRLSAARGRSRGPLRGRRRRRRVHAAPTRDPGRRGRTRRGLLHVRRGPRLVLSGQAA